MTMPPLPEIATACITTEAPHYPPAKIPLMPVATYTGLGSDRTSIPSLLDLPYISTSAGRAAIALALNHAGITLGDNVLVPAYHCESMIAPIAHVGAVPVFYRIKANTEADLEDLESKITPSTRAVLATHYFGFPQRITELRSVCDRNGLVLIEDCAHAFFGIGESQPIGTNGDYAIGSTMKFFPSFDGGLLASTKRDLSTIEQFRPSLAMEIKALVNIIEYAMRYGRLRLISLPLRITITIKDILWGIAKMATGKELGKNFTPASSEGSYSLDPQWIHARMSRVSEFVLTHSKINRIYNARRTYYRRIVEALSGTPGVKPLFASLPEGIAPLVVPMIVEEPLSLFPKLKRAGVPIWRFGEYLYPEIDDDVCENSVFLSRHVFQFPCHPELTDQEIRWMVNTIKQHLSD